MSVYNVRVYNYADGQQIRIYSSVYNCDDKNDVFQTDKKTKNKKDDLMGVENEDIWNDIEKYELYLDIMLEDWELEANRERSNRNSKARTIQNIYEISRANTWEYFVTLTFNPEKVDSYNYQEVTKKLSQWIKNLKKRYSPDLKYIIVPELHKSGRYHFHGLFSDIGNMPLVDSGKRLPDGSTIYNIGNYTLGFTTATKIKDNARVTSYIAKYITKELCAVTANKKRYWCSKNLNRVKIDEYVLTHEEINQMLEDLSENITYCKTSVSRMTGNSVKYLEVK